MSRMASLMFKLDDYLSSKNSKTFTQSELVDAFGLSPKESSGLIQNFLRCQKSDEWGSALNRRIYRVPGTRTAAAVWTHGDRSEDVRNVVAQAASDFKTRSEVLYEFLESVRESNPRAAKAIREANTLLSAAVKVLETAYV